MQCPAGPGQESAVGRAWPKAPSASFMGIFSFSHEATRGGPMGKKIQPSIEPLGTHPGTLSARFVALFISCRSVCCLPSSSSSPPACTRFPTLVCDQFCSLELRFFGLTLSRFFNRNWVFALADGFAGEKRISIYLCPRRSPDRRARTHPTGSRNPCEIECDAALRRHWSLRIRL